MQLLAAVLAASMANSAFTFFTFQKPLLVTNRKYKKRKNFSTKHTGFLNYLAQEIQQKNYTLPFKQIWTKICQEFSYLVTIDNFPTSFKDDSCPLNAGGDGFSVGKRMYYRSWRFFFLFGRTPAQAAEPCRPAQWAKAKLRQPQAESTAAQCTSIDNRKVPSVSRFHFTRIVPRCKGQSKYVCSINENYYL